MAFAAVAEAPHQVGAAVPLGTLVGHGLVRLLVGIKPVPEDHEPTHAEGPAQFGGRRLGVDRRDTLDEISVQRLHVLVRDGRERGVGHGRVEAVAIPGHPFAHRAVELLLVVAADAGPGIGRDVGGHDGAEGRVHAQAARKRLAARRSVAAHAVGGLRQVAALGDQRIRVGGRHRLGRWHPHRRQHGRGGGRQGDRGVGRRRHGRSGGARHWRGLNGSGRGGLRKHRRQAGGQRGGGAKPDGMAARECRAVHASAPGRGM